MIRRRTLSLLLMFAALAAGPSAAGAPPMVTLEELIGRLERAESAARAGLDQPSPARMGAVRQAVGLPLVVEVEPPVVLAEDALLAGLRGDRPSDFREAIGRLAAYRRAAEAAAATELPDPAETRAALDRAFRGSIPGGPSAMDRIREALGNLLVSAIYGLVRFSGPGRILAWVIVAALGAGALIFLVRLRPVPERSLPRPGGLPDEARSARDWKRLAEEALARGDLPEAVRAFYHVLLATLAAQGIVTDAPALTAGECRAAVASARPGLFPAVDQATRTFERVAYGGAWPGPPDIEALRHAERKARSR